MGGPSPLARAAGLEARGEPFVLATATWVRGPSSGKVGYKAIILPDGTVEGWLGGACATPTVIRHALSALRDGRARVLVMGDGSRRAGTERVAMACDSEGAMEVFVEPYLPTPHLIVAGESPMAETLRALAATLGWRAEVVSEVDGIRRAGDASYVVIATQGHFDEPALEAALGTPAPYIGLVSSAKRAASVLAWLRNRGVSDENLARVRAPAGLDLGSTSHEEIAVSVLAELVLVRASVSGAEPITVEIPDHEVDPVCGMLVDAASARFSSNRDGRTVFFCAAGCQRAFEADPAAYPARG